MRVHGGKDDDGKYDGYCCHHHFIYRIDETVVFMQDDQSHTDSHGYEQANQERPDTQDIRHVDIRVAVGHFFPSEADAYQHDQYDGYCQHG